MRSNVPVSKSRELTEKSKEISVIQKLLSKFYNWRAGFIEFGISMGDPRDFSNETSLLRHIEEITYDGRVPI